MLNLREERFEVLDSMRSLNDNNLRSCCDKIISGIKQCWKTHYAASNKVIDNYDLIDIQVPQQTNNHDCGYHMLLHCEHWNGVKMPLFSPKDIVNVQKIMTYKWLSNPNNEVDWELLLGITSGPTI